MAVLETIRSKAGTIIIVVIGLALFSFVMQDMFSSGSSMFSNRDTSLGEINGKTVEGEEFQRRLTIAEENYKRGQGTSTVDENTRQQLTNQVWNEYMDEYLFNDEMADAGIAVSDDELFDMVQGEEIDPQVMQIPAFKDSVTGQFDKNLVIRFIKTQLSEENDPDGLYRDSWTEFEQALMKQRRKDKYNNLIKKSMYVTAAQAKADFKSKNNNVNVRFVQKKYDEIPDSTITVSDEEIKNYYNEHKYEFEQNDETRQIQYVVIQVNPSAEDRQVVMEEVQKMKEEFQTTTNDTAFLNANNEQGYNQTVIKPGKVNPLISDAVFAAEAQAGIVYGPIIEGEKVRLVKVLKFLSTADSVKARHILISTREVAEAVAMTRADSLLKAVKSGADFAELARKFSQDPGSGAQGGDLGWFTEGQMVPEFNDACFNGKVGDLVVVKSQFGAHLINIQEKTAPNRKASVSYLDRAIAPSSKTIDEYYAKANDFAVSSRDLAAFDAEAKKRDLFVVPFENLKSNDRQINDLGNSREITQWAYNTDREIGEVSKVFDLDGKYIVAALKGIKEKGFPPFEQLRSTIEPLAKREKKAAKFIEDMTKAASGKTDIEAIGAALSLPVNQSNYNFGSFAIPGAANEPYVIGVTFALGKGKVSKPIKGKSGCYIVVLDNESASGITEDVPANQKNLKLIMANRASSNVNNALTKLAKVEDHRYKFF